MNICFFTKRKAKHRLSEAQDERNFMVQSSLASVCFRPTAHQFDGKQREPTRCHLRTELEKRRPHFRRAVA